MLKSLPPMRWAVEGLLPEGLAILAGKPKSGKSYLALEIAISVANGEIALNYFPTETGEVLFVAMEDGESRLQNRIRQITASNPDLAITENLFLTTNWKPLLHGGEEDLQKFIDEHGNLRLIVLDTMGRLRGRQKDKASQYDLDSQFLAPLQKTAIQNHLCVLMIHHIRKSESDDPFSGISGTFGLTGIVDTMIVLQHSDNNLATLHVRGRDLESDSYSASYNSEECQWRILNKQTESQIQAGSRSPEQKRILNYIGEHEEPVSPADIAIELKLPTNSVRHIVLKLARSGLIRKVKHGGYTREEK